MSVERMFRSSRNIGFSELEVALSLSFSPFFSYCVLIVAFEDRGKERVVITEVRRKNFHYEGVC